MTARRKPRSAAIRAKLSAAAQGNPQGRAHLAKLNRERAVKWTREMWAELFAGYIRCRPVYTIANFVGVDRGVVEKEMNRLGLPRGRWVTGAQRRAALEAALPRRQAMETERHG